MVSREPFPDPSTEHPSTEPPPKRTVSAWAVLALLGVLLMGAVGLAMLGLSLQRAEAGELARELVGEEAQLPLGLVFELAASNANQQRSVRWRRDPQAAADATLPEDVTVVRYGGPMPVQRQFAPARGSAQELARQVAEWELEPKRAFEAELGRGRVRFGRWQSDWVRTRLYSRGGTFRDVISFNISIGDRPQVLFARWPENATEAAAETLVPLLEVLRLDELWADYENRRDAVRRGKDAASLAPEES